MASNKILEELKPGVWLFVEHPGLDTPEMRAIGRKGDENVAADRAGVTHALTNDKVKAVVQKRGIKLVNCADVTEITRQKDAKRRTLCPPQF